MLVIVAVGGWRAGATIAAASAEVTGCGIGASGASGNGLPIARAYGGPRFERLSSVHALTNPDGRCG